MPLRTGSSRGKVANELALLRNLGDDRRQSSFLAFQKLHAVRKPKASVKSFPKRAAVEQKN